MEPHIQLFHSFTEIYRPYLNQINAELFPFNLASSQWAVMNFISINGTHTISDISIYQNVERPTITKVVQKLIELDYVEAYSGTDKRTKYIRLTETGSDVCEQVQEKLSDYQRYLLEEIPEVDQLLVTNVLRGISERITTYEGRDV